MSMFKNYSQDALLLINGLIDVCNNVGIGKELADFLNQLEELKESIEQETA
jgi:hypothetical protein